MSTSGNEAEGSELTMDQQPEASTATQAALAPAESTSNNKTGFKYKYAEAAPTPPGVDDVYWDKTYTAADSRKYNQHGRNSNESKKYRKSGETYKLALAILAERQRKEMAEGRTLSTLSKKSAPKQPKAKEEGYSTSRATTPAADKTPLSISEQIKSEGRAKKAIPSTSSKQGTPAPAPTPTASGPKMSPAKPTKKGAKKPPKKTNNGGLGTPSSTKRDSQTPGPRAAADEDGETDSNDGGEYCICRGPDDHRMMVYCDGGCDDWYHCSCIGIDVADARELLDRFVCPKCKTDTQFTTWKRMCRYHNVSGCRKAARPTADPPSKYCSEEHKVMFWEYIRDNVVRQDKEPSRGGALNKYEIADILRQVNTKEELDALGQKPRLPKKEGADSNRPAGLDYLTAEEEKTIADIKTKQQIIEEKLQGYKGQHMLLKLVIQRAKAADTHPNAPHKAVCGYDPRLSFNDAQFARWKATNEGKTALETKVLGPRTDETKNIDAIILTDGESPTLEPNVPDELKSMCLNSKKKCPGHRDWYAVHEEDMLYMSKNLRDEYGKLQKKADEIIDDAETREATKDDEAHNVTIQLF